MRNKILLSFVLISMIFISCEKCEITDVNNSDSFMGSTEVHNVNYDIINQYANARFVRTKTNTIKVDAIKMGNDTLAYIINHDSGWELLAADDRYVPILAKGEGVYDLEGLNLGQKVWLESELCNIKAVKEGVLTIDDAEIKRNQNFWKKLSGPKSRTKAEGDPVEDNQYWELVEIIDYDYEVETTGHLVNTKWGQDTPWNRYIPYVEGNIGARCLVGCVSVAGAQLLNFLHYDISKPVNFYTSGVFSGDKDNYTSSFGNPSAGAWTSMAKDSLDFTRSFDQAALLMAWVAYEIRSDFGEDGTEANTSNLRNVLSNLGITFLSSDYDNMTNDISYYLKTKRQPCILSAYRNKISVGGSTLYYSGGHVWLVDGYYTDKFYTKYVYRWTSQTDNHLYEYNEIREEIEVTEQDYLLMNWGWDGRGDNSLYATGSNATWQVDDKHYRFNRNIIYNFN